MKIGKIYSYPRAAKDLWDGIGPDNNVTDYTVQRGEHFVVLEESCFSGNPDRAHLKILTMQGIVGWIAYIDKYHLVEVKEEQP